MLRSRRDNLPKSSMLAGNGSATVNRTGLSSFFSLLPSDGHRWTVKKLPVRLFVPPLRQESHCREEVFKSLLVSAARRVFAALARTQTREPEHSRVRGQSTPQPSSLNMQRHLVAESGTTVKYYDSSPHNHRQNCRLKHQICRNILLVQSVCSFIFKRK